MATAVDSTTNAAAASAAGGGGGGGNSAAAKKGTPLHSAYTFSYMRRGKGASGTAGAAAPAAAKQPDGDGTSGGAAAANAPSSTTAAAAKPPEESKQDGTGAAAGSTSAADAANAPANPYENSIKTIATVSTVEEFWSTYDYLQRPNALPTTTDYHFFRSGIKPTWEDRSNAKGGKWIVRLPKGLASRYWEEIILALIGGQFSGVPDGEICGAVLSVRYSEDILGVWNRTSSDRAMTEQIRDAIKKVLQLPAHANMEYKPHQNAIQDRSSFRNTSVWKAGRGGGGRGRGSGAGGEGGVGDEGGIGSSGGRGGSSHEPSSRVRRSGSWGERGDDHRRSGRGGGGRESTRSSWRAAS